MKKKIFSVFSALTLICQVGMSAPLVMAEEETAVSSKVGLIYEFDGSGGMYIPEDLTSTPKVEYNVDGYATFEGEGTWKDGAGANSKTSPYVYASLGEDKIKFEDDKAVIIETKVRFRDIDEAFNAVKIGYNLPASGIDTFYAMDKTNNADVQYASNLITHMVEFRAAAANNGFIRFGIGNYWSGDIKYTSASAIADQWYTVIIRIKPGFIFDYYVLNADGTYIAYLQDKDQTYVTKSEYFENVAFAMTHGTYGTKTDIDYIKVYNIPLNVMDDYKDYKKAYNEKADKFTLNLSGDESDTWVAASGITPTISVNQKDADGTDYTRMIPAAANDYMYVPLPQKIKLNDNNTVIIDARIRGYDIDGGVGRMQLKWNMPTVSSKTPALIYNGTDEINATYNEALGKYTVSYTVGANHLVLADFLKDGLRLSDGIIKSMPAQTSWNTNLYGVTKGNINSKWWRMVVQIKPGYEVVYKLYDENNNPLGSEQTGTLGWVEQSGYLRNVAIQSFNGKLAYADVDYLNVYNVPLGEEDDFDKVEGTIDGVELDEVGKVDPNKAVVKINTAYDINKAVISYNAWDGETETLLKGVDYTVEEEEENSYVIEFDKTLKRSATYTIALTDTVKVEFDTEKAPETLYYDGFSSKTSLDDWELDFSGTYGDATVSDEEKIDVENGKLVVSGDRNVSDSETYAKLTAANIYSYKHGKQWNNYEYSLVLSDEN